MKDEVALLKVYDKMVFIVNYDTTTQEGSHWVGVVKIGTQIFHFGSYGIPAMKEITNKSKRNNSIFYNDIAVQLDGSSICGHLSLYCIINLVKGLSFREILDKMYKLSNRYRLDR